MSTPPILNGQVIGQAHYATRALLERALAPLGVSFGQSVALNALAQGATERTRLVQRMTGALKVDESIVHEAIAGLVDAGLAQVDDATAQVSLTETGRATQARIGAAIAAITARLYADIPTDEMSSAARVLTLVTQRANAELAAAPA
ncbi:hypothetical protein [Micromonospora vulcania]|uniref:MarR family transcriptional regulator n=1 Tax=Micromonospora vulcania TaxID=1441873 RepID=A0ABW1HC12_9ACTN